ncbi:hypothetical protein V8G54_025315 [Vigna mungo]|uniref:Uncharacterized protein n=1 Tax=Vigna mungo TaxID=3915 RepID=A0AAQ3RQX5_VIGMU
MMVGLRPFLSPVAPKLFLRTACCSIGLALPVYSTFKAIEDNDPCQQQRWLLQLYSSHLRPFLLKHQARMDVIVEFVYGVMSKLIRDHQTELEFARALAVKFLVTGTQMIRDLIHPVGRESNNIESLKRQVQDSESED